MLFVCSKDRLLPGARNVHRVWHCWDHCGRQCALWTHATQQVRTQWLRLHQLWHWRHWHPVGNVFRTSSMSCGQHRCTVCRVQCVPHWSQVILRSQLQLCKRSEFPTHRYLLLEELEWCVQCISVFMSVLSVNKISLKPSNESLLNFIWSRPLAENKSLKGNDLTAAADVSNILCVQTTCCSGNWVKRIVSSKHAVYS